jgi:hypothetical protein
LQQYKKGFPNKVGERGFSSVLTSIRKSEEIVNVARIKMYGFVAWLKGLLITPGFQPGYIILQNCCVRKRILFFLYG